MLTRRHLLAAVALSPLAATAACSSGAAPAATRTPSPSASAAGEVLVYVPGAMAATTKKLATAWADAGLGTATFEVGHTPVQREQLAQGAAPDVWIAANPTDMQTVADKGLVDAAAVTKLARTKLVVVVAPGNPGGVESLADLAEPGLKLLLGAETLPIWNATSQSLDKMAAVQADGFRDGVLANVVSREMGVQPIVQKVTLGEADAGIVFVTDLPDDRKGLTTLEIPDDLNQDVPLVMAPVTAGKHPAQGRAFIEFMLTGAGRTVLDEVGYLPPAS